MNKPTHAWLAVEAFRMIQKCAATAAGKKRKLDGLAELLGQNLRDVVAAAWLPDSLIMDMSYGHIFKMSSYQGDQEERFTLDRAGLKKELAGAAYQREAFLDPLPAAWWKKPYRATEDGGDLPNRVLALAHGARDMLKMGDDEIYGLAGIAPPAGRKSIAKSLLYSTRDVAVGLWMASHYVADAHMPFHCDDRRLGDSKAPKHAHGDIEDKWGDQVADLFQKEKLLRETPAAILAAVPPATSQFKDLTWGDTIPLLPGGDPWKQAVFICRASFAMSFVWVPETVAAVDDQKTSVSRTEIFDGSKGCGEEAFWQTSRAIMHDAVTSIAMFWQDVWRDFVA